MFGKINRSTGKLQDTCHYKSGGGKSQQTSTQSSAPWSGVQPYLTDYLQRGQTATRQPYQFYNGTQTAGFSPTQQAGQGLATQRALAGSPTLNAANTNITNTLNGNYLDPASNPYLKSTVNQALGDVQTRVNSQFNNSNFGSSAHQETLARDLGNQANQLYGANYSNERNNQLQAAGQAPGLASADYQDANQLQQVGGQQQQLSQQYLDDAKNQFNGAANFPYEQLQRYGQVVGAGSGQGGTSTLTAPNPNKSNGFASALGTGLSIAGLFSGGGIFSDARLKANIEKVGELPSGLGIYDYDKFGKRERGVMAQEVEQVIPDA